MKYIFSLIIFLIAQASSAQRVAPSIYALRPIDSMRYWSMTNLVKGAEHLLRYNRDPSIDASIKPLLNLIYYNANATKDSMTHYAIATENALPKIKNDSLRIAFYIALSYAYKPENKSFSYASKAYDLALRLNLPNYEAQSLLQMGIANYTANKREIAQDYWLRALALEEKTIYRLPNNKTTLGNPEILARLYYYLGAVLIDFVTLKNDRTLLPKGEAYILKAIATREKNGFIDIPLILTYRVYATFLDSDKQYKKAEVYYLKVIDYARKKDNKMLLTSGLLFYTGNLIIQKRYDEALRYDLEVLDLQKKTALMHGDKLVYEEMTQIYKAKGNYKQALVCQDSVIKASAQVYAQSLDEKSTEIEGKFKNDILKKDVILKDLEVKNARSKLLFVAAVFLMILLGIGFWYYRKEQKRKLWQAQQAALQEAETQRRQMAALVEGEERERTRIARELHDGLGALLSAAKMNSSILEEETIAPLDQFAQQTARLIGQAVQEVRTISHNLMPEALLKNGLQHAISELVESVNQTHQTTVHLSLKGFEQDRNDARLADIQSEIAIFRIVQELLNNTLRHAHAKNVFLTIEKHLETVNIAIKDDGVGFDTNTIDTSKGIGWRNIFSRVTLLNGTIRVLSELQKGTETEIVVRV